MNVDWMQTYSGKRFHPLSPRAEDIDIVDIAHALSMACRYGGHCKWHYSVAQHCVLVASKAPPEAKLHALLHDASEAYLGDVIRPLKHQEAMSDYRLAEHTLEAAINRKFLTTVAFDEVKLLDNRIITDEKEQLMVPTPWDHLWPNLPALGVTIKQWSPETARWKFLNAFEEYSR